MCLSVFALVVIVYNPAYQSSSQYRMPSNEEEATEETLSEALLEADRVRQENESTFKVPLRDENGRLSGDFEIVTWNKASMEQVQAAHRADVRWGKTFVGQAVSFPATHVGFAMAIHMVSAVKCAGLNPFGTPVSKNPSCGEDSLVELLTDPLGITGFYAFMVASHQVSGRLNNLHIRQLSRRGLNPDLSETQRKTNVRNYMRSNGLFKISYGYIGMAVGSLTQDLLMDLMTQSKPCMDSLSLGLGLDSTECKSFASYMIESEKWLEFLGSTANMLTSAFASMIAQSFTQKLLGPILGKTVGVIGKRIALIGFTFMPGTGQIKVAYRISKPAGQAIVGGIRLVRRVRGAIATMGRPVANTFSHAIYFVSAEEYFRPRIMPAWYNFLHNNWYTGRQLGSTINVIQDHQKDFWKGIEAEENEQEFLSTLREMDAQFKEAQEKSHMRELNEERLPAYHRKAAQFYASYEATKAFYSYINEARSEEYQAPLTLEQEDVSWLFQKVNQMSAQSDLHIEHLKNPLLMGSQQAAIYEAEFSKVWIDSIKSLFTEEGSLFDLQGYLKIRAEYMKAYFHDKNTWRRLSDILPSYWYEIDSLIEAKVTSEGVLSKFYSHKADETPFYEIINDMAYAAPEEERFFPFKKGTKTTFDWIVLKALCGDQEFEIKDIDRMSLAFTPKGLIDREKVQFNCNNFDHAYPLIQNKYKSDYSIDKEKLTTLRTDFDAKVPTSHPQYEELNELVLEIESLARDLVTSADFEADSVSWSQVIAYTSKLKKLYGLISETTLKPGTGDAGNGIEGSYGQEYVYIPAEYLPSITEETGFNFQVRELITEKEENEQEYHATSRHVLYSAYDMEGKPLAENEYSALHFLLNPKVPLKTFIKSDLNIWWLENVQKKTLNTHLKMTGLYRLMIEEEILSQNAIHLKDYSSAATTPFEAIEKAGAALREKTIDLSYTTAGAKGHERERLENEASGAGKYSDPYLNATTEQIQSGRARAHREVLTSESYDLQMLSRARFYTGIFKSLVDQRLFSSVKKTEEEIATEAQINLHIEEFLVNFSEMLAQLSYNEGDIEESGRFVKETINKLNRAVIANHRQFAYPDSYEEFSYFTDEDFEKANENLKDRVNAIFSLEAGEAGAFIMADGRADTYRANLMRAIRDHYSLYLQNVMLVDDERKIQFRRSYAGSVQSLQQLLETIKASDVKNLDTFDGLTTLLLMTVNDVNDFYNRYIEGSEILPHAGLAAISAR